MLRLEMLQVIYIGTAGTNKLVPEVLIEMYSGIMENDQRGRMDGLLLTTEEFAS